VADVAAAVTVGEAVQRTQELLRGLPDAPREAAELYAALVRRPASAAWLDRDLAIEPDLAFRLEAAARRRAALWPQAYAAGAANFRGHWLGVDRRVLIPRPETEGLVDLVLESVRRAGPGGGPVVVADVGTGSGAIAVALAIEAPALRLVATDGSAAALEVARANVAALGVGDRVELRHGHLLEPLGDERLDAVVSNPPYVATGEWERLDTEVRDFEPREALDGGPDGLAPTRELVTAARSALRPGGLLALEVDARRAHLVAGVAAAQGFESCDVIQDLSGRPRYVRARRPGDGSH
jgi:release factor glutamine methyltransferase